MIKVLRELFLQYKKWKSSVATRNIIYHFINRERKYSFGNKNKDKTFYVIRSLDDKSPFYIGPVHHLLANYFYVISHLWYAKEQGWIPIVDQQNYPVYNSLPEPVHGTANAWEYFWKQPSEYSLEEVYSSKNVILSKRSWFWQWDMGYDTEKYSDPAVVSAYHEIMKIIPLKRLIAEHVEKTYQKLFPPNKRVLGVSTRYVGYSKRSYRQENGHPIAPELDSLVKFAKEKIVEWKMDYIFLACDDRDAENAFSVAFGDRLICLKRNRTDTSKTYTEQDINPLYYPENIYMTSLNYLTEMELLSRCTGLIGTITSGFRYAVVKNNNAFEHLEIIKNGLFPDKRMRIKNNNT